MTHLKVIAGLSTDRSVLDFKIKQSKWASSLSSLSLNTKAPRPFRTSELLAQTQRHIPTDPSERQNCSPRHSATYRQTVQNVRTARPNTASHTDIPSILTITLTYELAIYRVCHCNEASTLSLHYICPHCHLQISFPVTIQHYSIQYYFTYHVMAHRPHCSICLSFLPSL